MTLAKCLFVFSVMRSIQAVGHVCGEMSTASTQTMPNVCPARQQLHQTPMSHCALPDLRLHRRPQRQPPRLSSASPTSPLTHSRWSTCVCFITGLHIQAKTFAGVLQLDTSGKAYFPRSDSNIHMCCTPCWVLRLCILPIKTRRRERSDGWMQLTTIAER